MTLGKNATVMLFWVGPANLCAPQLTKPSYSDVVAGTLVGQFVEAGRSRESIASCLPAFSASPSSFTVHDNYSYHTTNHLDHKFSRFSLWFPVGVSVSTFAKTILEEPKSRNWQWKKSPLSSRRHPSTSDEIWSSAHYPLVLGLP